MSVANIVMCEFKDSESIDTFCEWYKGHGSFPDNKLSLWVKTGEKTAISINVYPNEETRSRADKIREDNMANALKNAVTEVVPLSGEVLVTFLDGELIDEMADWREG